MTNPKIQVIQNSKGEWHFRLLARNGKSVLIGGETFKNKPTLTKINNIRIMFYESCVSRKIQYLPKKSVNNSSRKDSKV